MSAHTSLSPETACDVTAWLLAGGEGRRMEGQDKGLLHWQGRPLSAWVLDSLAARHGAAQGNMDCATDSAGMSNMMSATPCAIGITANRHADAYRVLLTSSRPVQCGVALAVPGGVLPDDADLPERSGPLAGILTALRHSHSEWVLVAPCDTPRLPPDLLPRLLAAVLASPLHAQADIAVPLTVDQQARPTTTDGTRHHWVCALIRKRLVGDLAHAFMNGERKVGSWIQTQAWVGVCFNSASDFQNINTTEALHGRD